MWNSTIKVKTKECKSCGEIRKIFARDLCSYCYQKEQQEKQYKKAQSQPKKKSKQISPISKKMAKKLSHYRKVRDKYMKEHKTCEFEGCKHPSQDLHHVAGRGKNLSNVEYFMAVCRKHHNWIHDNDKEAREKGYLISRLSSK